MVYFLLSLSTLRKKSLSTSNYAKGMLACSKPLFFMSMEANLAAWRFLMSSLSKNILRGLKHVVYYFTKMLSLVNLAYFFSFSLSFA